MKTVLLMFAAALAVFAQSSTPITYPAGNNAAPTWVIEPQAMPTSPTVKVSGNVVLLGGWVSCTTARTITITDGNSIDLMTAIPVAANSVVSLNFLAGTYLPTTLSISASGSGCNYSLFGRR